MTFTIFRAVLISLGKYRIRQSGVRQTIEDTLLSRVYLIELQDLIRIRFLKEPRIRFEPTKERDLDFTQVL